MKLYHYTARQNAAGIHRTGQIDPSSAPSPGVNLTSDLDHVGHGLPDGRALSVAQARNVPHWVDAHGRPHAFDHTEFRLGLAMDEYALALRIASAVLDKLHILALEISGYFPCDLNVADEDINLALRNFNTGVWVPKGPTWWFHLGAIPASCVVSIEQRTALGYVPADWPSP